MAPQGLALAPDIHVSEEEAHCGPDYFFEGAEKLLEIWFTSTAEGASLRLIPQEELVEMLDLARCKILHWRSNDLMNSYLLSESSMFVADQRIILKTCGTTQLLETVPRVLELAEQYAGMTATRNVYYSRKNFMKPHLQPLTHGTFDSEVDTLNKQFNGSAFCLGSLLDDRWFLYTGDPRGAPTRQDQTLEIQMTKLSPKVMKLFSQETCSDGKECTLRSGIDKLVPKGTLIHEELFEPVGYSMNGLVPDSDEYVTIHITPESAFSYVSFETNNSCENLFTQSLKVIECFRPGKFLITLFANDLSENGKKAQLKFWHKNLTGYRRVNLQFLQLQYDTLMFAAYEKDLESDEGETSE